MMYGPSKKIKINKQQWQQQTFRAHIKLSIFENIFSEIEKVVNTFSISKKGNNCVPLGHRLAKFFINCFLQPLCFIPIKFFYKQKISFLICKIKGKLRNKGLRVLKFYILKNRFFYFYFRHILVFFTLFLIELCKWLVRIRKSTTYQVVHIVVVCVLLLFIFTAITIQTFSILKYYQN